MGVRRFVGRIYQRTQTTYCVFDVIARRRRRRRGLHLHLHHFPRTPFYIVQLLLQFENSMIFKLDILFEGNRGDEEYKNLFKSIMLNLCEQHSSFKTQGVKFVKTVSRLMERLLEYRSIITDENKENRMSCTVNLLVCIPPLFNFFFLFTWFRFSLLVLFAFYSRAFLLIKVRSEFLFLVLSFNPRFSFRISTARSIEKKCTSVT